MAHVQRIALAGVAIAMTAALAAAQTPLGSGFTYQGELQDNGTRPSGDFDFRFTLFDAALGGFAIGTAQTVGNVAVTNGLFTVTVNSAGQFGAAAFSGEARWLEIEVRRSGTFIYTALSPRQAISAAPYAMHALNVPAPLWNASGTHIFNSNSGNVGIDIPSPQRPLHVRAAARVDDVNTATLELEGREQNVGTIGFHTVGSVSFLNQTSSTLASFRLRDAVGTDGDHFLFTVGGVDVMRVARADGVAILSGTDSEPELGGYLIIGDTGAANVSFDNNEIMARNNDNTAPLSLNADGGNVHLVATGVGGVSIGTTTIPAGVLLAVDGKVLCEELEVQLSQDWPDYVFADDYTLMPLADVATFVKRQRHLPGVPSAADVQQAGVRVGEMQAVLLRKIEELTLHMIAMDERLAALRTENDRLANSLLETVGGTR